MGNKLDHPDVQLSSEKFVIVTGGNAGIGYETAKSLAAMGARVCIACRSEEKAKAVSGNSLKQTLIIIITLMLTVPQTPL